MMSKMKKINYLRASLALPFAVGLFAKGLQAAGISNGWLDFIGLSMVTGGLPLLATAAILLYISFRSTQRNFERWWLGAPCLMALLFGPFLLAVNVYSVLVDKGDAIGMWGVAGMWFVLGMFSLGVGYLCIAAALALYILLRWAGLFNGDWTVLMLD